MNPQWNATKIGIRRGWREWLISLRNPGDVTYTILGIVVGIVVVYLYRDDTPLPGVATPMAVYVLASILAVQVVFTSAYALATVLSTEREDGTLLRMKSLPCGLRAYTTGLIVRSLLEFAATAAITILLAAVILWPGFALSAVDVLILLGVLSLGIVALTAFGFVIGSLFRSPRAVGGWGLVVAGALVWVSGLIQPLSTMAPWVQILGQASPLYWMGLGIRSSLLPDEFVVIEIGDEWRLGLVFLVLIGWAVAGLILAPALLSRMARRETVASVEQGRQRALQRV
ncbi:ABC transporter permease [Mycetocola zhadangensis]|uniref:ABC transporter permease n=1 Tax=Mycetocola zhadangensis TaxID=1164595 RepID=A0A3L7J4I9_9MICO|nr:ABC transporter permease [Mycetocola zhadangensis]RLQ85513.1 ABC transporter permease [Mycetocola zhadangensis]GGE83273.1 transport permease protein [Mycetocola zhadangensis]